MGPNNLEKIISTPQAEKEIFEGIVEKKAISQFGKNFNELPEQRQMEAVREATREHQEVAPSMTAENYTARQTEAEAVVLALAPDEDDRIMETLLGLVQEKGILNTINAIEKTESFHIQDDFHRLLVQYIKSGYAENVKESSPLYPGLNMTLFEVSLPESSDEREKEKTLEQLLSSMEQFYAGMFSVAEGGGRNQNYFSIEIAYPQGREEVVFFSAIPNEKKNIFKNQVLAIFPNASIKENTNDYNIFNKKEFIAYSEANLAKSLVLPIKTYKELNYDPLNILLKSFSNLDKEEGAAIQIILSPDNQDTNKELIKTLDKIAKGDDIDSALKIKKKSLFSKFLNVIDETILASKDEEKKIKDSEKRSLISEEIKKKNSSRFYRSNIRLISAGNNQSHADAILMELESAFHQFENTLGNKFEFKKFKNIRQKVKEYTFRIFDAKNISYFNTTELTTIFHFPEVALRAGENLSTSSFASAGVSKKLSGEAEKFAQANLQNSFTLPTATSPPATEPIEKTEELTENLANPEYGAPSPATEKNTGSELNYTLEKSDDSWVQKGRGFDFGDDELGAKIAELFSPPAQLPTPAQPTTLTNKTKNTKPILKNPFDNLKDLQVKEEKREKETNQKQISQPQPQPQPIKTPPAPAPQPAPKPANNKSSQENLGDASFANEKPILLGYNTHQGVKTDIYMKSVDRMRHMYVIGKSGTGKTNILKNMIIQDIKNGDGCCFMDPHGSDIEDILEQIPPHRHQDVIYFDPTNISRPMGMNMLEYDPAYPEQKTFVVDELFGIFKKLYAGTPESMGPAFEQYFRNATLLVLEHPESGNTMVEISRVLSDENYRNLKLKYCKNMIVKQFWEKIATQAGGDAELANIVPYITNKFDVFLANDFMRPIIAQEKSAFNFRDVMDNKKILLVNLSKGKLGDLNSNLIGLILVGKILMAALSRVDSLDKNLPPFYLYMDEFQNITTDSISQILSEARKYKLSLNIAHQFINQIEEGIRDAIFGNVGSMAVFRVGPDDAEFLEKQFAPTFTSTDILNLQNYNAYVKMLVDGEPQKPFNLHTYPPQAGNPANKEILKKMAAEKFGRPREEIEAEVNRKFASLL